jgi:hypothetical protein
MGKNLLLDCKSRMRTLANILARRDTFILFLFLFFHDMNIFFFSESFSYAPTQVSIIDADILIRSNST